MNELDLLHDVGNQTPLPALADLSPVRARVLAGLTEESAPRRRRAHRIAGTRRRPRRIVIGGVTVAAAAAVAAGVLLAVQAPGGGSPTAPRAGSPVLPAHLTAVQVLDHAAHAALAGTAVPPRPGQFVYSKAGNGSRITQSWLSVDGSRDSRVSAAGPGSANEGGTQLGCEDGHRSYREPGYNGKPYHGPAKPKVIPPMDGPLVTETCTPELAYFPDMPTTERAMGPYLKQTRDLSPSDLNNLVKSIGEMLESDYILPAQRAALYELLASTPGLVVEHSAHDISGRPGIGVGWSGQGGKDLLIFDRSGSKLLGFTTAGEQGQIGGDAVLTQPTIVNRVGQQP